MASSSLKSIWSRSSSHIGSSYARPLTTAIALALSSYAVPELYPPCFLNFANPAATF